MPDVIISPEAREDLLDILQHLSENLGQEKAEELAGTIRDKFQLLAQFPQMGRTRHELLINLRGFPFKKFTIFYIEINEGVEIVRVLHGSRDIQSVFDNVVEDADSIN